jgi:phosphopantothenoylcysteine decarboxylase / phosphopantothenate---cysteine ligase
MNILLAVSGSIASYKSYDLLRDLLKNGYAVKVILTQGALKFIHPDTFKYLGASDVYLPQDDFNLSQYQTDNKVLHIDLARWCDQLVIYPASASTINRLGQGIASDLLGSVFLSLNQKPTYIFPAMNPSMLTHPITSKCIKTLSEIKNIYVSDTQSGTLVCGENGDGKLHTPEVASLMLDTIHFNQKNKTVLITTGASMAKFDDVRYLTNPSSGLTGFYIAKAFLKHGHAVHILAGKNATKQLDLLAYHPLCKVERLSSNAEFALKATSLVKNADLFIASAALCDFEFESASGKIKKSQLNAEGSIKIHPAQDILKTILDLKIKGLKTIGFAAETSLNQAILDEKWQRKPTDLLVANTVKNSYDGQTLGFQQEEGVYIFKQASNTSIEKKMSKAQLAEQLVNWYEKL